MLKVQENIPIYLIEWSDASGDSGWIDIKTKVTLARCFSVGILISDEEDSYTLAQSLSPSCIDDTQVDNRIVIPKSGIIKVTHLTIKEDKCKGKKRAKKQRAKK
jgi:hypothetical protein